MKGLFQCPPGYGVFFFFIVLIYFPAKLTIICRYKDFHLFIFPSANIIEGAEALSPGQRPGFFVGRKPGAL